MPNFDPWPTSHREPTYKERLHSTWSWDQASGPVKAMVWFVGLLIPALVYGCIYLFLIPDLMIAFIAFLFVCTLCLFGCAFFGCY